MGLFLVNFDIIKLMKEANTFCYIYKRLYSEPDCLAGNWVSKHFCPYDTSSIWKTFPILMDNLNVFLTIWGNSLANGHKIGVMGHFMLIFWWATIIRNLIKNSKKLAHNAESVFLTSYWHICH